MLVSAAVRVPWFRMREVGRVVVAMRMEMVVVPIQTAHVVVVAGLGETER